VGKIGDNRAIPDISAGKEGGYGKKRPILHLKRGFFGGGVSEIHPGHWSIENHLHWMLDESVSRRRMPVKDG
jgi:hypothetical protein